MILQWWMNEWYHVLVKTHWTTQHTDWTLLYTNLKKSLKNHLNMRFQDWTKLWPKQYKRITNVWNHLTEGNGRKCTDLGNTKIKWSLQDKSIKNYTQVLYLSCYNYFPWIYGLSILKPSALYVCMCVCAN